MGTKLYVGGLSYDTDDESLRALFSGAGEVKSAQIIRDRETGSSKGFGFVEMASEEEAKKAISLYNGAMLDNRQIRVDEARPREPRPGSGGGFRGGGGGSRPRGGGGGRRGGGGRERW